MAAQAVLKLCRRPYGVEAMTRHRVSCPARAAGSIGRPAWSGSTWCARPPLARELARAFGADPDEAFTHALLHDVGKLVRFDRVADERRLLRRDGGMSPAFVTSALGSLHEILGGLAMLEWGLAPSAAAVVAGHHRTARPAAADPLSEVVFLAERLDLADWTGVEPDVEWLWTRGALTGPRDALRRQPSSGQGG